MDLFKLLNTSEIVAQILSFLILFFILRIFVWKRILNLLDQRREKIVMEFKKADDVRIEAEKFRIDYEKRMLEIEDSANRKIQEAIAEGRKITEELRKKAYQEAQEIILHARENIKYELTKAKEELKDKVIDLTIAAAENMIQEKLTAEGDRKIVEDFLKKLDEA